MRPIGFEFGAFDCVWLPIRLCVVAYFKVHISYTKNRRLSIVMVKTEKISQDSYYSLYVYFSSLSGF